MKNGRFLAKEEKIAGVLSKIGNICSVVSITAIALVALSAILVKFLEIEHDILLFIAFLGPGIATVFGIGSLASTVYGWFRYVVLRKKVDKKGEALNEGGNQLGDFLSNLPDMLGQFFSATLSQAGNVALVASVAASTVTYVPAVSEALNYNVRPPQIDNIISEVRAILGIEEETSDKIFIDDNIHKDEDIHIEYEEIEIEEIEIEELIPEPEEELIPEVTEERAVRPYVADNRICVEALPPPEEEYRVFTVVGRVDPGGADFGGAGVLVELMTADNRVVTRTRSDVHGNYVFMYISEGDYHVRIVRDGFDDAYGERFNLDRRMPSQYGVVELAAFALPPVAIVAPEIELPVVEEPVYLATVEEERETYPTRLVARGGRSLTYSVRPELLLGSSSAGVGASAGLGVVGRRGFYTYVDFRGGPQIGPGSSYYGGDINFGYMFNRDGLVKNVLGLSFGWQNMESTMRLKDSTRQADGSVTVEVLAETDEQNYGFGGVFWKFLFGKRGNIDVTNKLLFGHRNMGVYTESVIEAPYIIGKEQKLNVTYSLGVGWTWIRNRSAVRIVDTVRVSPRRNQNRNARRNARIEALVTDTTSMGAVADATRIDTTRIEAVTDTSRRGARRNLRRESRR